MFPDPEPMVKNGIDPGKPLFLTPYIERGDLQKGDDFSTLLSFSD